MSDYSDAGSAMGQVVGGAPWEYWRMGESSGAVATGLQGTADGAYVGAPTLGVAGAIAGDADTAVTFNGTSQYMTAAAPSADDVFSIACWAKRATHGVRYDGIISQGPGSYGLVWQDNDYLVLHNTFVVALAYFPTPFPDTNWHFIVATKNGTAIHLYVDSVESTGIWATTATGNGVNPIYFGLMPGPDYYFAGTIDEGEVWQRAITPHEVDHLYAVGKQTHITGVTRDNVGGVLVSVPVKAHYSDDGTPDGAGVTSDAVTGAYSLLAGPQPHFLVAYKVGSPDVAGVTVNTLAGS